MGIGGFGSNQQQQINNQAFPMNNNNIPAVGINNINNSNNIPQQMGFGVNSNNNINPAN